jgi:hypothetical protein
MKIREKIRLRDLRNATPRLEAGDEWFLQQTLLISRELGQCIEERLAKKGLAPEEHWQIEIFLSLLNKFREVWLSERISPFFERSPEPRFDSREVLSAMRTRLSGRARARLREKKCREAVSRCEYCHDACDLKSGVIEHCLPVALGGKHIEANLKWSCVKCNKLKGILPDHLFQKLLECKATDLANSVARHVMNLRDQHYHETYKWLVARM